MTSRMPASCIAASTVIVSQVPPAPALLPQSASTTGGASATARASVCAMGSAPASTRCARPAQTTCATRRLAFRALRRRTADHNDRGPGHRAVGQRKAAEDRDVDHVAAVGQRLGEGHGGAHRLVGGDLAQHLRQHRYPAKGNHRAQRPGERANSRRAARNPVS
jgi:hypothetical protein